MVLAQSTDYLSTQLPCQIKIKTLRWKDNAYKYLEVFYPPGKRRIIHVVEIDASENFVPKDHISCSMHLDQT